MIKEAFGSRIRHFRKEAGMTQEQLSLQSGVGFRFLQDIEAGVKQPTITTTLKLADALNVTPGALLDDLFRSWQLSGNQGE